MLLRRQLGFNLMASHLLSVTLGGGLAGLEKRGVFYPPRKSFVAHGTEKEKLHTSRQFLQGPGRLEIHVALNKEYSSAFKSLI